jgi:hypothetical protein
MRKHAARLWEPGAEAYLRRFGIGSAKDVEKILSGFDFARPVYEQPLSIGQMYYQFVRTPSADDENPALGGWYCLKGQELTRLAIHSPGAARRVGEFQVVEDVIALEGIAIDMETTTEEQAKYGVGGLGGGTQIYLPPILRSALLFRGLFTDSGSKAGLSSLPPRGSR